MDPPQAGQIAHDALLKQLEPHCYNPSNKNPKLWKHNSRPINFTFIVNGFGVKYSAEENALHLQAELKTKYRVTTDWQEKLYIGIEIKWDREKVTV